MAVFTPKQADREDSFCGFLMMAGVVIAIWAPGAGIALILASGIDAICIAIDRHLPPDSPHRNATVG